MVAYHSRIPVVTAQAYGIVWKAVDRKHRTTVALKKCFDAFRNSTDAQRTYREIMYLQELGHHDNIIRLCNVIKAENDRDIFLVFDFMGACDSLRAGCRALCHAWLFPCAETDLHAVVRANILEDIHKQYIIYQLLKSLKFMHSAQLIHRDIKPSNLLLNSDCHVKLCDFGLCRSIAETTAGSNPVSWCDLCGDFRECLTFVRPTPPAPAARVCE